MKKKWWIFLVIVFAVSAFCEDNFNYGFMLRLRQEYFKNAWDFNNQSPIFNNDNYFRIKGCFWMKYNFNKNVSIYTRLTSEPDIYLNSKGTLRKSAGRPIGDDEIVFDNLYLDVKNAFGLPLDLRIGRQDFLFTYGEGFVILDGTPYDGSRTVYFNATKATYHFNKENSLDFIFIYNRSEDEYLPVINNLERRLNTSDEKAFVLYGKLKPAERLSLEPYYIYKSEDAYKTKGGTNIPKLELNTVGTRSVYSFAPWRLRGELAYQFGDYENYIDRNGLGGYVYLTRFFKEKKFSPSLDFGFAYLSGDYDKTKNMNTGWDPLFSRWPWISELYLFSYVIEGNEPAYWTNLQLWRATLKLNLTKKTNLAIVYNYLRANECLNGIGSFGTGKERGHMPQIILKHKFNKNISGHLWCEYFIPGDFYASNNQDPALFLRWQMVFKF